MGVKHVLIFVVAVLLLLLGVSIIFPKNGIKINSNLTLYFPTLDELLTVDNEYADINDILLKNIDIDSLLLSRLKDTDDSLILNPDELKRTIQQLEYGKDGQDVLHSFFNKLKSVKQDKTLIRVMHYGDSQIECDRISSFLRYRLQNQFGGCGIGLMPVVQPFDYQFALSVLPSENWKRYTSYGKSDTSITHRNYGFLASFCRFAPVYNDSINNDTLLYTASVTVTPGVSGYNNARKFRQFRIFYGNNKKPVHIEIANNNNTYTDTLQISSSIFVKNWVFDDYTDNLQIQLKGYDSPDVYALAFDDTYGVAVDNIALRGNSGTIFTSLNYNNLSASFNNIKTELFILQFGGNVLPWIDSEDDCKSYARSFLAQLKRLKSIKPDAGIIVVGPADKSVKEKDKYVSYKYIEPLIKEMKKAAFEGGAAYWDIYKAMGGKNSMPSWVNAELAGTDYIHFSTQGASIIANMLYNALIYDYNKYMNSGITRKKNDNIKTDAKI